jgi:hypothetical protein
MIGTASRKTDPHQKYSSITPPINGPIAPPAEKLPTQIPMASVRCLSSRNMFRISDKVEGASVAAEIPRRPRAKINISALLEKAATTEVAPKKAAPIISNRRRPIRSPSVPIVIRNPASKNP